MYKLNVYYFHILFHRFLSIHTSVAAKLKAWGQFHPRNVIYEPGSGSRGSAVDLLPFPDVHDLNMKYQALLKLDFDIHSWACAITLRSCNLWRILRRITRTHIVHLTSKIVL